MSKFVVFTVLFAAAALSAEAVCGKQCNFGLCRIDGQDPPTLRPKGPNIILRGPDTSRTGYICRSFPGGKTLGTVKSTGTAVVSKGGVTAPIDEYSPDGMSPSLPHDYFRLYNILYGNGLQGVGRKASRGNQEEFLDDLCVTLPITSYDILNTDGSVARSVASTNPKDCISFETIVKPIVFEAAWDSSDDMDLRVEGPSGSGTLIRDQLGCNGPPQRKETVFFNAATPGDYKITLTHYNNCGDNAKTKYVVNAIVNGVRVFQRKGRSSVDGRTVLEATITV